MRLDFTDQFQDSNIANTYDFPARKMNVVQGRWLSPDPAGLAAMDLTNPQTFNRYAYVGNNPLAAVDPLGLCSEDVGGGDCSGGMDWGGGGGGSYTDTGYCSPKYPYCGDPPPFPPIGVGGGGGGSVGGGSAEPPAAPSPVPSPTNPNGPPSFGNNFIGFNLFCSGHTISTGPLPSPNAQPGAWSCALYFLQWQLGSLGTFLTSTGVAGSVFIPLIPIYGGAAAVGANVPFAILPESKVGCIGIGPGVAAPATKSVNFGPLLFGNLSNSQSILSGWSFSFGMQPNPARGAQYIWNFSGPLGGPTAGSVGTSAAFTISGCAASPF